MPFGEKCKAKPLHVTGSLPDELKGIQRTHFLRYCVRSEVYLIHMHVSKVIIVNNMLKQQRSLSRHDLQICRVGDIQFREGPFQQLS